MRGQVMPHQGLSLPGKHAGERQHLPAKMFLHPTKDFHPAQTAGQTVCAADGLRGRPASAALPFWLAVASTSRPPTQHDARLRVPPASLKLRQHHA